MLSELSEDELRLLRSLPYTLTQPPAAMTREAWLELCRNPRRRGNGMAEPDAPRLEGKPPPPFRAGLVAAVLALRDTHHVALARDTIPILPGTLKPDQLVGVLDRSDRVALLADYEAKNCRSFAIDAGLAEELGVGLADGFVMSWHIEVDAYKFGWLSSGVRRRVIRRFLPDLSPFKAPHGRLLTPLHIPQPAFAISRPAFAGHYCLIRIDQKLLGRIVDCAYRLLRRDEGEWVGLRTGPGVTWMS